MSAKKLEANKVKPSFAAIGIAQYFEGIYRGSELDNWITKFLDKQLARKVK